MASLVEQAGGRVIKTIGDELMCSFASPVNAADVSRKIQENITQPLPDVAGGLSLRIGFHHGEVLSRESHGVDDVFGDAVNVAARLAETAKAGQVLASAESIGSAPHRSLGELSLKGRQRAVDTVELLWQNDTDSLTAVALPISDADIKAAMRLTLKFDETVLRLTGDSFSTTVGRDENNDVTIDAPLVSRHHATIEARAGYFALIDRSTNGTLIDIAGETLRLHRAELRLRQAGRIHLGGAQTPAIEFSTE